MLVVTELTKVYGAGAGEVRAIDGITLRVDRGEFVSLVGPSGCGKTSLLKCLAGLSRPTTGTVRLDGRPVDRPLDELALVFQDYSNSLMPWMSVRGNVELPLRGKKNISRRERHAYAEDALSEVGLTRFFDHYPWQLSGGMQQRVAIARALAYRPQLLLMDEPFASVDAQVRADLEDLTLRIQREHAMTVLFVTHDIDEAVYLGDRVIALTRSPSRVSQDITVPLPRSRDQVATKELAEFVRLRGHILQLIRSEREPPHTEPAKAAVTREARKIETVGTDRDVVIRLEAED